jgi:cytochrome c-type biogenesis protein CcmH
MVVFWILATCMALVALVVVLVPLLRTRNEITGPTARDVTLEVLRGQRQEIEADIAAGSLPAEAREEALAELVERAGADLPAEPAAPKPAAPPPGKPWLAAAVVAIAIPALAFGLYAVIGSPSATDPKALQAPAAAASHDKELVGMIDNLARKVRERPDDARGWELLARSMMSLGRFTEAAEAYAHLAKLVPNDPQILADYADALGMTQGRSLLGKPRELAEQALAIDPKHPKALALAGTAAMDAHDWVPAMGYWQRLAAVVPPDSQDATQLRAIMDDVRQRAGPGVTFPAATQVAQAAPPMKAAPAKADTAAKADAPAKAGAAPPASAISGSVTLAPGVGKLDGGEHLFILARAEGGPRVPLAVVKLPASVLPYQFALDDSQSMAPGMNISSAQAVRIEARVSRSGNVKPQTGDLVGTSDVVKPGARGVKILVDKVVP